MGDDSQKIYRTSEAEKLEVLASLELAGSVRTLDRLLRTSYAGLATSVSEDVRARYARWQEVARKGLAIEEEWGEGALLNLNDPIFVDMRARGEMNPVRIRNAEAYAVAHLRREFSSPSFL
ncbi:MULTISPECIES: hypothetical protein [unclassified Mesorhizobium]|uniref:hypothetical protein n=1 Tax=unclassified Mesorhizobium TaxID=325217 RepID=UPI0011295902|nr:MULTISPECIES: hypothetical protein [unclassified Mesorhizobium]TPK96982.1 hypothetical protein FJ567_20045 [Mesorhizobium sp. B2-4-16]TPL65001.1 hypothetical protein FJ956_21540 [Mesorhizobium sp. B2-4-3]